MNVRHFTATIFPTHGLVSTQFVDASTIRPFANIRRQERSLYLSCTANRLDRQIKGNPVYSTFLSMAEAAEVCCYKKLVMFRLLHRISRLLRF